MANQSVSHALVAVAGVCHLAIRVRSGTFARDANDVTAGHSVCVSTRLLDKRFLTLNAPS